MRSSRDRVFFGRFAGVMVIQALLIGATALSTPQKNEFIVAYDPVLQPQMDLQLMQCINTRHWHYRQLSHGKTLEEKLFFTGY